MKRAAACIVIFVAGAAMPGLPAQHAAQPAAIAIDYPADGSVFPPEITPPTFLWRDPVESDTAWRVEVAFSDGSPAVHATAPGERLRTGEIDTRAVGPTNRPPELTPQQAAARTWVPDTDTWEQIKRHSVERPATVTIIGFSGQEPDQPRSRGQVTLLTAKDPVGAPIFYRDVPLMPSEVEKGVIKPLAPSAIPLIAWRLRYVGEPHSRLMMEGLHTCANCHSFSRDGKTLGMDMDGPQNDKGMYALVPVSKQMSIRNEDVIEWSSFRGKLGGKIRVGFMSQVSPDGQYVVTMINGTEAGRPSDAAGRPSDAAGRPSDAAGRPAGAAPTSETAGRSAGGAGQASDAAVRPSDTASRPGTASPQLRKDLEGNYYVANFKDYRFLQVFYPTRGILAWYSRATGRLEPLPGADDPRYVHTNAVWSPDGKYLVFARAEARVPYPEGQKLAEFANDPNETQIQFDLYRIPFNQGKGGKAEPIAGASRNGMSNSFPKVSPDGRWIVFVQARNGLLMRPDGKLYIVPAGGGKARRLRCNTPLMNSWHSFSPDGRWLVFSSKSRSPYTQMYLTHLDKDGNDSPAILIENTTAANRAVNIPEFLNVGPDGLTKIDTPATDFYRFADNAWELSKKGQYAEAVAEWNKALELSPGDEKARNNVGLLLISLGRFDEAIPQFRQILQANPAYPDAHSNLGVALAGTGKLDEAVAEFGKALEANPASAEAHNNLGRVLMSRGELEEAVAHFEKALETSPDSAAVRNNFALALARQGKLDDAIAQLEKALATAPDSAETHNNLGRALAEKGRPDEAIAHLQRALDIEPAYPGVHQSLGRILAEKGRFEEAIGHFRKALEAAPDSAEVHNGLAVALVQTGRPEEAVAHFQRALEINPDFVEAHFNLGDTLYYVQGKPAEALAHWRAVLRIDPNHVQVLNQTAWVLATSPDDSLRDGAEAVKLAEHAVELSGGRLPAILDTLAAAYAEAGRFAEAVEITNRTLSFASQQNNQRLAEMLRARNALYGAKTPFRDARHPAAAQTGSPAR